jgi:hypothetical protein
VQFRKHWIVGDLSGVPIPPARTSHEEEEEGTEKGGSGKIAKLHTTLLPQHPFGGKEKGLYVEFSNSGMITD